MIEKIVNGVAFVGMVVFGAILILSVSTLLLRITYLAINLQACIP